MRLAYQMLINMGYPQPAKAFDTSGTERVALK